MAIAVQQAVVSIALLVQLKEVPAMAEFEQRSFRRRLQRAGSVSIQVMLSVFLIVALIAFALVVYFAVMPPLFCRLAISGPLEPGSSFRSVQVGARTRCYQLHVPPTYQEQSQVPLIISLHGFASAPQEQHYFDRWDTVARDTGALVAYPQGSSAPLRWNTGPEMRIEATDDIAFIAAVIDQLTAEAKIDPERIYVTGFANGGEMAHQVGCALADRIAALGVVGGLGTDPPDGCTPSRPLPVIAFSGTDDPLTARLDTSPWIRDVVLDVSTEPGETEQVNPQAWIRAWARRNGCALEPTTVQVRSDVDATIYTNCRGNTAVELYEIKDGGHGWPGGPSISILTRTTDAVDATALMFEFFQADAR